MKRFSKFMLSVAAVSAVSAAMVVSASAMSASYADGTVTLTDVSATGDSQTLLVLNKNAETVASEDITQIDQKDDGTPFEAVPVGDLADGTYYVRVGGTNGTLQTAEFIVSNDNPIVTTKDVIIGDVDENGRLAVLDSTKIQRKLAGTEGADYGKAGETYQTPDGGTHIIGDVDQNGRLAVLDSTKIQRKLAGTEGADYGTAGEMLTVVAE